MSFLSFFVVLHLVGPLLTQGVQCDTSLVRRGAAFAHTGYQARVGRCEGVFGVSVSAPPEDVELVGLVESFEAYDLRAPNDIRLAWDAPPTDSIFISARGRRPLLFYRMDAARASADTVFRWPFGVLTARNIPSRNLAVLARSTLVVAGARSNVYFPLRLGHLNAPRRTGAYQMVVMPNVSLQELSVGITALASDGSVAGTPSFRTLTGAPFDAQRGVDIRLTEITRPGLYRVMIAGTRRDGSPANAQWLILVPARPAGS